ncbi:MAG: hypothetical protein U5Q44_10055 [Dehalococcoidia bacterium]|nr:hypothetical protein [Dehalococcoidia bacterium]
MERAAADDLAIEAGDLEVANAFVDFGDGPMQHVAAVGPVRNEFVDSCGVGDARRFNGDHQVHTPLPGERAISG